MKIESTPEELGIEPELEKKHGEIRNIALFGIDAPDGEAGNFTSLPNIIDKIGGVEINITDEEVSHVSGISSPGKYNLTGAQALAYSRIRYCHRVRL